MLNLFIGMIIENFAFITDDVSHNEQLDWGNGASADQITEIAEVFTIMGMGTEFLPLEAVPKFINGISRPLGMRLTSIFLDLSMFCRRFRHIPCGVCAQLWR